MNDELIEILNRFDHIELKVDTDDYWSGGEAYTYLWVKAYNEGDGHYISGGSAQTVESAFDNLVRVMKTNEN